MDRFMSHAGEAWGASVERLRVRRGLFAIMGSMKIFDLIEKAMNEKDTDNLPLACFLLLMALIFLGFIAGMTAIVLHAIYG
jgi:hypothetical protein